MQLSHQRLDQETFLLVAVERQNTCSRCAIANVVITGSMDGPLPDNCLVNTITSGKGKLTRWFCIGTEKETTLHARGLLDASHEKRDGGQVQQTDNLPVDPAGNNLPRSR